MRKTENQINTQYENDMLNFEGWISGKKEFDYQSFKRLVLNELRFNTAFKDNTCCGYKRCQIEDMALHPEKYGKEILRLSRYMYKKSGYYKRLIDYFANQTIINYYVDTQITSSKLDSINEDTFKKSYIRFIAQSEKFNLRNEAHNIFRRLFRDDICYAFVTESESGMSYFYLDPMFCQIESLVDGNVYEFSIRTNGYRNSLYKNFYATLPTELQDIIDNTEPNVYGRIPIPYDKSLCIKYNNDFLYPYPPFFMMIADILLIDDYKDLAKAQSINDAYKLLTMKIPTNNEGSVTMDDKLITAFTSIVLNTVQDNIGVITTPFDMKTEEFSSSNSDDRDTVSDAISWAYKDVGVAESLMSGGTTGAQIKFSITNDDGDIFRHYRQIEYWVALQMRLRGLYFRNYGFTYNIFDMTTFNKDEVIGNELSMAQNGLPNKFRLCAANGISPAKVIGNTYVETKLFGDMLSSWCPLQTSYTQSSGEAGRPTEDDADITASGQQTRDSESNDPANRNY